MRGITKLLAALLSLLLISTPMSASACDLSCWLRSTHSACHTIRSATEDYETPRSAHSGMDMNSQTNMGSPHKVARMNLVCERPERGARLSRRVNKAGSVHSMYPQIALATKRFADNMKPKFSSTALHSDSAAFSSCENEACSQTLISASPPGASQCQPNSADSVGAGVSICIPLGQEFDLIAPRIPPPKALPNDFATILRI